MKTSSVTVLFFLLFISYDSIGQNLAPPKIWDKRFGGTGQDNLEVFYPLSDGTFLAGGNSMSGIGGDKTQASQGACDFWVVKIDANGTKIWDKRFGGGGGDYMEGALELANGKILLIGYSGSSATGDKTQNIFGGEDYWILEIDQNGIKIWDKDFGGTNDDYAYQAIECPDHNIIIAGYSASGVGGNKTTVNYGANDQWLVKIDTLGNLLNQFSIGGSSNEIRSGIDISNDGFIYTSFETASSASGNITSTSFGGTDYMIFKLDQNLNEIWQKRFGSTSGDYSPHVGCVNNKISLCGYSYGGISGNKTVANHGDYDYWNVIVDQNGICASQKTFGGNGSDDTQWQIFKTNQNNMMAVGTSYSGISGDKTQSNLGGEQTWAVLFDTLNNVIWDRTVLDQGHDELGYCCQLANGSFIIGNVCSSNAGGDKTQNGQGGSDYFMICLAPSAVPEANFYANQNVCVGSCINFSYTGSMYPVGTLQWSFQGGNPATATGYNPQICYTTPGYYDVQVIATNSLGADTLLIPNYIHVLQNVNPVLTYSGGVLQCNTGASSVSFQWYLNGAAISGATDSTFIPMIDGVYSVIVNPGSVCPVTLTFTVNNLPAFVQSMSANMNYLCPNNCIQFSATTFNSPTTYQWIFQGASPSSSSSVSPANICYPNPGNFDVTLIVTNAYGSDTLFYPGYVHVLNLVPQIINQNDTLICNTTGSAYQWYLNNFPIGGATNQSYIATQAGNYQVMVTSYIGCAAFSNLLIIGSPSASFNFSNNIICAGECLQFNNTSSNSPTSTQWIFGGGIPATSTTISPTVCFYAAGNFSVTLIETNQFGADTFQCSLCITVYPQPATPTVTQVGSVLTSTVTGTNYQWYLNGVLIGGAVNQSYTATQNGIYTVEVFNSNGCSAISAGFAFTLNTLPTSIFTSNLTNICQNNCISFTDQSLNSPITWNWSFTGGVPANSVSQNPVVCYSSPGTYSVTLITHNAFGNDTLFMLNYISVSGNPSATISQSVDTLFTIQGTNSYQWTLNNNNISGATDYFYVASVSGNYNVIVTNQFGCSATNAAGFSFSPSPQSSFVSGNQHICTGNCILFTSTSTNQPTNYQWNFPGGNPSTSTSSNQIVCYNNSGSYNVQLITSNATGADTFVINNYVIVDAAPIPIITLTGNIFSCSIQNYNGGVYTYQWFENGIAITGAIDSFYQVLSGGIYNVAVTGNTGCLAYGNDYILNINNAPNALFNVVEFKVCPGLCTTFDDLSTNFPTTWNWSFPGGFPSTSNQPSPTVCYFVPGFFDATLITSNAFGSDTFSVPNVIQVVPAPPPTIIQSNDSLFAVAAGAIGYQWNNYSVAINGATNSFYVPDSSGVYGVMVHYPNQCDAFNELPDTFYIKPFAQFAATDSVICQNDCIDFYDQSLNMPTNWNWIFNGAVTTQSSLQNPTGICYTVAGDFIVSLTAGNLSGSDTDTLSYIHVVPALTPVITNSGGMLHCNYSGSGYSFQWYFNGVFIAGATADSLQQIGNGTYTVTVQNANGCSATSPEFIISGVDEMALESIKILVINNELIIQNCLRIQQLNFYNLLGQQIVETVNNENMNCIIPLKEINCNSFIIEIRTADNRLFHQLIINP